MVAYQIPYTYDEIVANYGDHLANKLKKDPVHRYRMETGIELIHKEPTIEELNRIYENWTNMDLRRKRLSNKKSLELYGLSNRDHYKQLLTEYK